jgi:hypothetical protein
MEESFIFSWTCKKTQPMANPSSAFPLSPRSLVTKAKYHTLLIPGVTESCMRHKKSVEPVLINHIFGVCKERTQEYHATRSNNFHHGRQ